MIVVFFACITVTITDAGRALLAEVLPSHIEVVSGLLFEPLSRDDVQALAGLLAPVRDHMRSTPPRSAAPPQRRCMRTRLSRRREADGTYELGHSGADGRLAAAAFSGRPPAPCVTPSRSHPPARACPGR
ncbi:MULTISPECIES: hypothetical protein [unclassified Nonomuraea]|uniref:hypothetical protein n=1 Tax=unclassified Nonomuraea TaxID=2593643 RepID=UPI0033E6EC3D